MNTSDSSVLRSSARRLAASLIPLAALAGLLLPLNAPAQTGAGSITGTVLNQQTSKVLERAIVSVDGTNLSTLTAPDGSFRISAVPAGVRTVRARYADLTEATAAVEVPAGGTASIELALQSDDVVQLGEFRVSAEPEGNAYAVQQQKNAESQRTVVSADAFGVISDANPGEFLKLMPGIEMDYTGIEPRGLKIRGMEPNLNLVMINGNQAAAAASTSQNRNFEFDQITLDNIESIEVFKAAIPSMPANSIGGTVNMITRSAFQQKGRRIEAKVNITGNSDRFTLSRTSGPNEKPERKVHPGGSFYYSDVFLDGRLGVALSLSTLNVNGYGGTAYNTYTTNSSGTFVSQYNREDHQNFSIRNGGSLNVDYKVNDTTTAYIRTTITDHYYEFRNRFIRLNTGTIVGTATPQRVETTGGNAEQNMSFGDKYNDSWTINPGVKHRWDDWTVEYDASLSRATNHYDYLPKNFGGVTVRNSGIGYILEKDPSRANAVRITQTAGTDIYRLANFIPTANSINVGNRNSVDRLTSLKGRVRRDFAARFPFYVEGGLSYQQQERSRHNPSRRWSYAGPDGTVGTADDNTAAGALMGQFAERGYTPDIWFGERAPDAWISPFQLANYYNQQPSAFVEDLVNTYTTSFTSNQRITETIYAGYVMANVKFGKLDVLAGLRTEQTYVDGEGARRNNSLIPAGVPANSLQGTIAALSRTRASNNYTSDPFKYLHFTWRANDDLLARLSYSEAIGRPNFGSIIPNVTINDGARTVTAANTTLRPQRAENIDFSVEWYPSGASAFTAAWFRKDIKDYIANNTTPISSAIPELELGPEYTGYNLITSFNLGNAYIAGYELSGRYRFRQLPGLLKGFELFGNYTHLYETEGTFNAASAGTEYSQLPGLAPKIWNLGFNFYSPDGKLFVTLKANHVDDLPQNILTQQYKDARTVYDAEIRYQLTPRYTLSLAGRNVTEAEEGEHLPVGAIRTGTGGGTALTLTLAGRF